MTDWSDFINCPRGLLIAPAGHGKTTAIADCLLQCPENSCQLVLTHTNAGLASLRTKFCDKNVPGNRYQLETITGFAQRYVLNYLGPKALPEEDDPNYFDIAIDKCRQVVESSAVQKIIQTCYDGVFVDEYQDCTVDQHAMIMELARNLPLHLLGDPMQAIFSFESTPLVDFAKDLPLFKIFRSLPYPWRWDSGNPALGQEILRIRTDLEKERPVRLMDNYMARLRVLDRFPDDESKYRYIGNYLLNHDCNSLLILCPSYKETDWHGHTRLRGDLNDRIRLKQRIDYNNTLTVVDAIDSAEYYNCAKGIDRFVNACREGKMMKRVTSLYDVLENLHLGKTELNKWINREDNSFKHRQGENAPLSSELISLFEAFETDKSLASLKKVIDRIVSLPGIKVYHQTVCDTISKAFDTAITDRISMFEAMKQVKDRIRHQGRKIEGRCIGTTLLTKGLEFDTVIILDAHRFEDAKNFYVAISRACKELIIITDKTTLEFKDKPAQTQHEHVYQPTLF
ncbi:MAG: UvrD-helicase domain-containing protein [Clostridia bacterium]|nr:UvrD-helicase domain-containing protein [Clostridia bacterium]